VSTLAWIDAQPGTQVIKTDEGNQARAVAYGSVLAVLRELGTYETFLQAVEVSGQRGGGGCRGYRRGVGGRRRYEGCEGAVHDSRPNAIF
jgi:hypothetical protein